MVTSSCAHRRTGSLLRSRSFFHSYFKHQRPQNDAELAVLICALAPVETDSGTGPTGVPARCGISFSMLLNQIVFNNLQHADGFGKTDAPCVLKHLTFDGLLQRT